MKRSCKWRAQTLFIFVLTIGGIIIARLFLLQIIGYNHYNDLAENQHQFSQKLFPQRGEIFIQDLKSKEYLPLAVNKEFQQVYAIPKLIPEEKREEIAEQLSSILEMDKEVILNRINKPDDPYEPLKHKLDKEKTEQIENLKIEGVKSAKESWRYYPAGSLASHLVGFVGLKDEMEIGQYGLEGYYEEKLKGAAGFLEGWKDILGYLIPAAAQKTQPAQDGSDLILTIDQNIQFKKYWDLSYNRESKTENEFSNELLGLLKDSVQKRLMSDVPLGAYVSGGVDSSVAAVLIHQAIKDQLLQINLKLLYFSIYYI